jgi:hypothetical protein
MDVFATRKNDTKEIKIGVGHDLFQIRWEDRHNVSHIPEWPFNWRLPYPDEDGIEPGDYQQWMREYILENYTIDKPEEDIGGYQLFHKSGLILGVICYHGAKLPEKVSDYYPMWRNERDHRAFSLMAVRNIGDNIKGVIRCRWCGSWWDVDLRDILSKIDDVGLRERLMNYVEYNDR